MRNKQSALSAGNPPNLRKLCTVRFEHEAEVAFKGLLLQDAKDGFEPAAPGRQQATVGQQRSFKAGDDFLQKRGIEEPG